MSSTAPWLRRPSQRHRRARIHLPPLTAEAALQLVAFLERAIAAVWRAHGDDMADHLAMLGIDTPPPEDAVPSGKPDGDDDIDF